MLIQPKETARKKIDAYVHVPDNLTVSILKPRIFILHVFNYYYYQICQQNCLALYL